jgi:hypothetical protein
VVLHTPPLSVHVIAEKLPTPPLVHVIVPVGVTAVPATVAVQLLVPLSTTVLGEQLTVVVLARDEKSVSVAVPLLAA